MWKSVLFSSIWIGITIPLVLAVIFTIFEPLLAFDTSGILMLIIMAIGAIGDIYLATRIWTWIEYKLYKRKHYM
ncbi:hypothetical protein ADM98_08840 [Exiguobacterium sp. BMC-KP]|uniref:hypothetical protein n=1 Tax=Exiguobacterium sp. BMC-KP TaxID=1684312 RepID=UPI0006AA1FD3|nr:hypothetical protein [Exiguobacterium sp. BMC-KP]KOP29014.1 hypothetical protein ADM98_08840 [Exiguobacterium sp. BMC-KP]